MSTIERAEVFVASPGRNFVTLRITTSDGVTGLGDATLNGRELAVASYLRDHLVPLLIGRDPARIEDMWQYLYRGAYWRRGPVTMTAIAAVDTALWDIKGKVAGLPVYQLLGGRSRDGVLVYAHASGTDVPSLLDDVARFRELGYQGDPRAGRGAGHRRQLRRAQGHDLRAGRRLAARRAALVHRGLPRLRPGLLAAVRERFGFDFHLLHDVHHRLTPDRGRPVRQGGRGLPAVLDGGPDARRRTRRRSGSSGSTPPPRSPSARSSTRSGTSSSSSPSSSSTTCAPRSCTPAASPTCARIFDLAALYQVRTGSHGATDLSPVTLAAAVHLDLAIPNFGIQEYMAHADETDGGLPHGRPPRGRHARPRRGARPGRRVRREGRRALPVRAALPARSPAASTARSTTGDAAMTTLNRAALAGLAPARAPARRPARPAARASSTSGSAPSTGPTRPSTPRPRPPAPASRGASSPSPPGPPVAPMRAQDCLYSVTDWRPVPARPGWSARSSRPCTCGPTPRG